MKEITTGRRSISELRRDMSSIRRLGGVVATNYFNQCNDIKEDFPFWKTERTVAFIWDDGGIKRVYFYSSNEEELLSVLQLQDKGSVVDFVGKDKEQHRELFLLAGYKLHLQYGRFHMVNNESKAEAAKFQEELYSSKEIKKEIFESPYGEMAKESDAEEIDRQLREKFDPYEAHFYPMETLREHIRKGEVWIAKQDGKIVAANLFEIQGNKVYGAYMYNYAGVDVLASLIAKVSKYLAQFGDMYFYCWMNLGNKRALRYNMKVYGYTPDGLYDMIYVKE